MSQPMPCPPPCPPAPGWADEAMACWDQLQQLQRIITSTMNPDIQKLQIAINNLSTQITNITNNVTPIMGVTDGSQPKPGQVGEFKSLVTPVMNFNGSADSRQDLTTTEPLPAGYWMCHAYCYIWVQVTGAQFYINPVPAGLSDSMGAVLAQGGLENLTLVGPTVNANFAVATPMTFTTDMNNNGASNVPGTCQIRISAWRTR